MTTSFTSPVPQRVRAIGALSPRTASTRMAVSFFSGQEASTTKSTPSLGNRIVTLFELLLVVLSPFQMVFPRCEIWKRNGKVVEVIVRRTGIAAAAGEGGAVVAWVRAFVRLRSGRTSRRSASRTKAVRKSGEPFMGLRESLGYFNASTIVVTLCFIIPPYVLASPVPRPSA